MGGSHNLLPEFYMNLVTIWLMGEWLSQQMILAVCVSQILYVVSVAGSQALRFTDRGKQYSFAEQLVYHIQSWLTALFIGWLYILFIGYDLEISIVIALLILYRLMDSLVEILEVEFRLQDRTELEKQAFLGKKIFPLIIYTIILIAERNLVWACAAAVLAKLSIIIFLDIIPAGKVLVLDWRIKWEKLHQLRKEAFSFLIIELVIVYTFYAGRVIMGIHSGSRNLIYYQEIFLLCQLLFPVSILVIQTPLEKIRNLCTHTQYHSILKHIGIILIRLILILLLFCFVFWLKGSSFIDILYGTVIRPYRNLFCLLSLGMGIRMFSYVLLKILVWMKQSAVWVFVVSGVCAVILNHCMIAQMGGAALAFVLSEGIQAVGLSLQFLLKFLKENKKIQ